MLSEEEKVIQFYKRFIEAEEQELEWMYREDEEYYRDSIEQKELLIKGWRNILNLITKLQKENEELKSDNLEKARILEVFDDRKYRKKYLEERRKEEPNLLYPDGDEIYKRYYEQKKQIDLMAEELVEAHEYFYSEFDNFTKDDFIEHFEKLAKEKDNTKM